MRQPLELRAPRPPLLPQAAQIGARRRIERREVARQKSAHAEEQRVGVGLAQQLQRQTLGEEGEGQLVALVAERGGERLEERFVGAVHLREPRERRGFAPEAELRRAEQHFAHLFLRQFAQRTGAAARLRLRLRIAAFVEPGSRDRAAPAARCDAARCG